VTYSANRFGRWPCSFDACHRP